MNTCQVHKYHSPHISMPDVHHIWPKSEGGPDIEANRITVCPTGHRNIHELLSLFHKNDGKVSWPIMSHYGSAERFYAQYGYKCSISKSLDGA